MTLARTAPSALIALALLGATPDAQVPSATPTFEVASVRPNFSDGEPMMSVPPRGTVTITNVPLRNIIVNAFRTASFLIVGAPDWAAQERFDITAKPPDAAPP